MRSITHSISVRRERYGSRVVLEDKESENGRASLLRITYLNPDAAIHLGREMVRLGLEASREGAAR